MRINNLQDLVRELNTDEIRIKRDIYKMTECGAWFKSDPFCISIGSIDEGVDAETVTQVLTYPFDLDEFWGALKLVEIEADEIWMNTHGCENCYARYEMGRKVECEAGCKPVDPNCRMCGGKGVSI